MANTRAVIVTYDKNREKSESRLGSEAAWAQAATWHTFANAYVEKDGSGYIQIRRDGEIIHRFEFGPENGEEDVGKV